MSGLELVKSTSTAQSASLAALVDRIKTIEEALSTLQNTESKRV
jgi:hypothetical protein